VNHPNLRETLQIAIRDPAVLYQRIPKLRAD
jgi:hypothetical protein